MRRGPENPLIIAPLALGRQGCVLHLPYLPAGPKNATICYTFEVFAEALPGFPDGIVLVQANCHSHGLTHEEHFHTNPTRQRGLVLYPRPGKLELAVNAQDHELGTLPFVWRFISELQLACQAP